MIVLTSEEIARFWSHVDIRSPEECWLWSGETDKDGYGRVKIRGIRYVASRVAYSLEHDLSETVKVLHSCDTPSCMNNVKHLRAGSQGENIREAARKGRLGSSTPRSQGSTNAHAKLTEDDVREIRRRYSNGETRLSLAKEFNYSGGAMWSLLKHKTWRHVP